MYGSGVAARSSRGGSGSTSTMYDSKKVQKIRKDLGLG
eukprot:CAMPEP_0175039804 /NCGR_PEP_ID=MMETSP0052_2-20121109/846_1 /TAXON_ID=51329 ORGANISM="Polytomella parva, Strain SAG 63-3" /NCGR_SAMPLE_ID=MMETSP0052_2 /ASSEMBLY_ACC=CAM_ASM_000194 /LENGTH=37 /DNA_ID= /DNA_START= /DNA_END= /DNA_ORIENTATION=